MLEAPQAVSNHSDSRELRRLLDDGFAVTAYRLRSDGAGVQVSLQQGDESREVSSADLAFAVFAAQAVPSLLARAAGSRGAGDPPAPAGWNPRR